MHAVARSTPAPADWLSSLPFGGGGGSPQHGRGVECSENSSVPSMSLSMQITNPSRCTAVDATTVRTWHMRSAASHPHLRCPDKHLYTTKLKKTCTRCAKSTREPTPGAKRRGAREAALVARPALRPAVTGYVLCLASPAKHSFEKGCGMALRPKTLSFLATAPHRTATAPKHWHATRPPMCPPPR